MTGDHPSSISFAHTIYIYYSVRFLYYKYENNTFS